MYGSISGTCIRDYIHNVDLYRAHLLVSQYLKKYNKINQLNLGYVTGLSVQEVINTVKPVTGKPINIIYSERRWKSSQPHC